MRNICLFLVLISLCGCGVENHKSAFKKALDNYYQVSPVYIDLSGMTLQKHFPKIVFKDEKDKIKKFELFCKAGLVSPTETIEPTGMTTWEGKDIKEPAIRYSLTEKGKKFYRESANSDKFFSFPGFIFGKVKVVDIINYTEPASNMMGQICSSVTYRTRVEDIVEWAQSAEFRDSFPEIKNAFDSQTTPKETQTVLVKTGAGWVHVALAP